MNQVPEKTISWSVTVCNKNLSSPCNLTAQIEPVQDKLTYSSSVYQQSSCKFNSEWWWGVLDTTFYRKVCHWLAPDQYFLTVFQFPAQTKLIALQSNTVGSAVTIFIA